VFGCKLKTNDEWKKVISDPRKNMLLDIQNVSSFSKDKKPNSSISYVSDSGEAINIKSLNDGDAVFIIKEYADYSPT
jgi:hypothetical protein